MTMRLLWFVLAGFLLGFAASTLWEWLHYRRERMKTRDERVQDLEGQLVVEQELNAQLRMIQSASPPAPPPVSQPEYSSPGVFLDSETSNGQPVMTPQAQPPIVEPEPPPPDTQDPVVLVPEPQPVSHTETVVDFSEPEITAFEEEPEDDTGSLERLAAELVRAPDANVPIEPERSQPYVPRSTDYPDNLSKIKGIGDVYKYRLYAAGIFTWHQVSECDIEILRAATNSYPGSNVDEWPDQAQTLAKKNGRDEAFYTGPIPDDLTQIVGIGPVGEQTLYRSGICTYDQLAGATAGELHDLFPIAIAGDEPDFGQWIRLAIEHANLKLQV